MHTAQNNLAAVTCPAIQVAAPLSTFADNDAKIRQLRELGIPIFVNVGDDGAVIDAYVTSAQAARMLAPLGRKAVGKFRLMPDNMVAIEAIVSVQTAAKMLEAARLTA